MKVFQEAIEPLLKAKESIYSRASWLVIMGSYGSQPEVTYNLTDEEKACIASIDVLIERLKLDILQADINELHSWPQ